MHYCIYHNTLCLAIEHNAIYDRCLKAKKPLFKVPNNLLGPILQSQKYQLSR